MLEFIGAQLGITGDALISYASRKQTRQEHMSLLRAIYGYKNFSGLIARDLKIWLDQQAEGAASNEAIAHQLVEECRTRLVIVQGYHRFRRYVSRMLKALEIQGAAVAQPLLKGAELICGNVRHERSLAFLRPKSKWRRYLNMQSADDGRLWEVAVLFALREAFRSGDIWLKHSRRHADPMRSLVSTDAVTPGMGLVIPFNSKDWLADRQVRMEAGLERLARAARDGTIPGGCIENGLLRIDRLSADAPDGADELILDLYKRIPEARITDILLDVDNQTGFTDAFTHLRTGAPCKDRIGLLNVLLAEGINLGLRKMAEATNTHEYWELTRLSRWHVEGDALNRALAIIVEAQSKLPMAAHWGMGTTASSDDQFFPASRQGEAMNLINAKYGSEPGLKAYTHLSDQFSPFATQNIPSTVNEAPYILDGLLMNEAGKRIREQYADTGGFTDLVFAIPVSRCRTARPKVSTAGSARNVSISTCSATSMTPARSSKIGDTHITSRGRTYRLR